MHIIANFCIIIAPNQQGNYSNPMQIAFNKLTEGIKQMNNTNTAEDYRKTAILVSTMSSIDFAAIQTKNNGPF